MHYMFSRSEAIGLSGLSRHQLQTLINYGIVEPLKDGAAKNSKSYYSWEQIVELKIIYKLRQDASLQQIRGALESLKNLNLAGCLSGLNGKDISILTLGDSVYLVDERSLYSLLLSRSEPQTIMIFRLSEVIAEIEECARATLKRWK